MSNPLSVLRKERAFVIAFLFGNFVIGTGVMLVPGLLIVLSNDLGATVPQTALLITVAAIGMCIGSPVLATLTSRIDRRTLLTGSLAFYAFGHALCAFAPSLTMLIIVRSVTMMGAAVFTPQAAADVLSIFATRTFVPTRGGLKKVLTKLEHAGPATYLGHAPLVQAYADLRNKRQPLMASTVTIAANSHRTIRDAILLLQQPSIAGVIAGRAPVSNRHSIAAK